MNCRFCGTSLPAYASFCPACGATTSLSAANADPTAMVAPPSPPSTQPATPFPPNPYATVPNSDYAPYQPPPPPITPQPYQPSYMPPPIMPPPYQPPLPPSNGRRGTQMALLIGSALLVLILLGGGALFLFSRLQPTRNQANTPTPTAQAQPTQAAATPTPSGPTPIPTPTNPSQNPYPPQTGTLAFSDPMHDNSKGAKWDETTFKGSNGDTNSYTCAFSGGAYHIITTGSGLWCNPEATTMAFNNVAFEAKLTVVKGDMAGLAVRVDVKNNTNYTFLVSTSGSYALESFSPKTSFTVLKQGASTAIKTGINQANVLALVANGTTLSAYVNYQFVASVQDSTYASGVLGVFGEGVNQPSDVVASDARVWKI